MGAQQSSIDEAVFGHTIGVFNASYLGSVPVKHSTGNDICADAVTRVRVCPHVHGSLALGKLNIYYA